jgi:LmbE family N-acetylglucosaminyl deacetylase
MAAPFTVLHLAPHPDDEVIAAPATLFALRDAGHRIVNLACSLGRPADAQRRRSELEEACRRAGFDLIVHEPPLAMSRDDNLEGAQGQLTQSVAKLFDAVAPALVVAPAPQEAHPAHEMVGRAARDAVARRPAIRLWMWGLWADLPLPTLLTAFNDAALAEIEHALAAHAGEIARNDYRDFVRGRALTARVRGSELLFGFGQGSVNATYAELLTEAAFDDGEWWLGQPRTLDPSDPLPPVAHDRALNWWMTSPSPRARLDAQLTNALADPA